MAIDPASPAQGDEITASGPPRDSADAAADADRAAGSPRPDNQFADATADPLAGALGGSAQGSADQAYRTWAQMVQPSGPVAVVGSGHIGDLHVGGTAIYLHGRREQATGVVKRDVLDALKQRYVRVTGYAEMARHLAERHLVALRGVPGTGRATTAMSLLGDVASGQVSRFDPDTDLRSLSEDDFEEGSGYLLEMAPGFGHPVPTAVRMDGLADILHKLGCFMVLVVPHDARYRAALADYVVECPAPDAEDVLDGVVKHAAEDDPGLADDLRRIAGDDRLRGLARSLLPSEVLQLAGFMRAHAVGDITFDDLLLGSANTLRGRVADWFDPLAELRSGDQADDQVRLAAFRIALAVFNENPLDAVLEAGELLAAEILKTVSPRRNPGRQVFVNRRDDYVLDSRARLVPGVTVFGRASVTSTCVAYVDGRTPTTVLRHVWDMHNVRGPMIAWLQLLSQDTRPFVWMRAALTIGLLSSWDFAYTFHQLIDPWANAGDDEPGCRRRRLAAAVALDAAGRNDDTLPVVRELIGEWCRQGGGERRWTAAAALGYDLGVRYAAKSLRDLRITGCSDNGALAPIASWAVMRIFARGGIEPVLHALQEWLDDSRRSVREFGLLAALRIADLAVSDLADLDLAEGSAYLESSGHAERGRWPLLVALAAGNQALREPLLDIVWRLTQALPSQQLALGVLTHWIRAVREDRACAVPVGRFLALLADDESDQARLLHLIGVLRRDPDQPLPADIADQLERAVELNVHDGGWEE